jgi:hypothetical protein
MSNSVGCYPAALLPKAAIVERDPHIRVFPSLGAQLLRNGLIYISRRDNGGFIFELLNPDFATVAFREMREARVVPASTGTVGRISWADAFSQNSWGLKRMNPNR